MKEQFLSGAALWKFQCETHESIHQDESQNDSHHPVDFALH